MKIIDKNINDLIPYEFNNKIHNEGQINHIANSIREFWFTQPIVIDNNNIIIIGHWRFEAAKKLWMDKVPVLLVDTLSDIQIKKLRIIDNKLNESERNYENLRIELPQIDDIELSEMFTDLPEMDLDLWNYLHNDIDNQDTDNHKKVYILEVICNDELDQDSLYIKLQDDWYNVRKI